MSIFGVAKTLLVFLFHHEVEPMATDAVSLGDVFVDHVGNHVPVVGETLQIVEDLLFALPIAGKRHVGRASSPET